jgi:hypothetical protein
MDMSSITLERALEGEIITPPKISEFLASQMRHRVERKMSGQTEAGR